MLRAFPAYQALDSPFVQSTWAAATVKIERPDADMSLRFPPGTHESNINFRLLIPVAAHVFHLGRTGILLLSAGAGVAFLWTVYGIAEASGASRRTAFLLCLSTACAWPGQSAFHELRGGYYDAFALCLVTFAFRPAAPAWATFLLLLAAGFCDERAFLSGAFLVVRALVYQPSLRSVARAAAPVVSCGVVYAVLRTAISLHYSWPLGVTGGVGLGVLKSQHEVAPLAVWSGLSGCWLIVGCGLGALVRSRAYAAAGAMSVLLALCIFSSLLVFDTTRSMAYCFPAVLVAVACVVRYSSESFAERCLTLSALACIVVSPIYVEAQNIWRLSSLPSHWLGEAKP